MKRATPPPLPGVSAPFFRNLLVRLLIIVVLAVSVWLVWSRLQKLSQVVRQSQQKTKELSALANEVDQLKQKRSLTEIERIEKRFQEAQAAVFTGPEDYAGWERALREQVRGLAFDVMITPGRPWPDTNINLSVRQATVDLQAAVGDRNTNSPYQRLLTFAEVLEKTKQRVDLVELSVRGNFNSVNQARAVLEVRSLGENR